MVQATFDPPLNNRIVLVVGRLHGLTRARLDHLVVRAGGKVARKPTARLDVVVIGHTACELILDDGTLRLPAGLPKAAVLVSELAFRRQLGLTTRPAATGQTLGRAEVERLSGLSWPVLAMLALFDVLEPFEDRYGYRDLVAGREVARLLRDGRSLASVVAAAVQLGRRGLDLSQTRLREGPSGELFREVAGGLADLSGQLTMPFGSEARSVDELFVAAEAAENTEDWSTAEGLYSTAARADQTDPVLVFNLGNVFDAQGRHAEAKVAWQIAAARDPGFAEAWYNLAVVAEEEGLVDLAVAQYRRALKARPVFPDASHNLALLLTRLERFAEALPLWDALMQRHQPISGSSPGELLLFAG